MPSLRRGEVALRYWRAGGVAAPVVLIHGWCCDHTYLEPQFDHFARRGHAVVAVDLRGHGESDKPRQKYTMRGFADDVVWMCGELALAKPLLIGHSMGGIVAFDIAVHYAGVAAAIVMLDAAVVLPAAARAAIPPFLDRLRGPDYRTALRDFASTALFIPTDDAARKARILDAMAGAPRHVMVSTFEALRDYDPEPARGRKLAPSLYVAGDEPAARSDIARLKELLPDMLYGQVVGAGHFCQLEAPDQVNAMIDRFLAVAPPSPA